MKVEVSALILAGGRSSRMGQDKALVDWKGLPILARVGQVAGQCCEVVYILSPWPDRYQANVKGNYQWLMEQRPGEGPLVALAQGLTQIPTPWLLLLACDLPCLQVDVLQGWIGQLAHLAPTSLAFVPRSKTIWEPLCGFYHQNSLPLLKAFIQSGGRSFQRWLTNLSVQSIVVDDAIAAMLWNCNTPADLSYKPNS